jgi:signal transduction histidine kinase
MRERVEQIGGTFAALTAATGATITATIPLGLP